MYCWYCYWGWPQQIADIYNKYVDAINDWIRSVEYDDEWELPCCCGSIGSSVLKFGPSHVVWEDENWDSADFCLKECKSERFSNYPPALLELIEKSLCELSQLPSCVLAAEPPGYDGEHPENFPPPAGIKMVPNSEIRD